MSVQTITPQAVRAQIDAGKPYELIDVRTPAEYANGHAPEAKSVPLDQFDPAAWQGAERPKPLYILCQGGGRAKTAAERCLKAGLPSDQLFVVEGGTNGWIAAGLAVTKEAGAPKVISLERQVRIVVGVLSLAASILVLSGKPLFAIVTAFLGAGLLFAGVTDTCGLAIVLSRMPWNRASGPASSCSVKNSCGIKRG